MKKKKTINSMPEGPDYYAMAETLCKAAQQGTLNKLSTDTLKHIHVALTSACFHVIGEIRFGESR